MKFKIFFFCLIALLFSRAISQDVSYLHRFSFNERGSVLKLFEYNDAHYLLCLDDRPSEADYQYILYKLDENTGDVIDSAFLGDLGNSSSFGYRLIDVNDSLFLAGTYKRDSLYYLWISYMSSVNFSFNPRIIDSIADHISINKFLVNKLGNVLVMTKQRIDNVFSNHYCLYEITPLLDVLKKKQIDHEEGDFAGIAETAGDSSYIFSGSNWAIRLDYNFGVRDTLPERIPSGFNHLIQYGPNTFFAAGGILMNGPPPGNDMYSAIYKLTEGGEYLDTLAFGKIGEEEACPVYDFLDFYTFDTLFYCGISGYDDPFAPYDNWMDVAKSDSSGTIIWQKYLGYDANYLACRIAATPDGGCLVAYVYWDWRTFPTKKTDVLLIKFDKYGNSPYGLHTEGALPLRQLTLYPNPTDNFINIMMEQVREAEITIHDQRGRSCLRQVLTKPENRIDISALRPGIYLYSVYSEGVRIGQGKFVKE